ncbi:Hsp70 family protein [uncultured Roseobacter sp.]|uniref:Hsp70 family protein n=1 Tax=uncultured Roseobacter sp. TaxID=114847 RepID=UPI0026335FC4|nr:Hsp70 family protein [uncultured Roseobacter sp.]
MSSSTPLAIDFGTSNSAAALLRQGAVHRILIERGQPTLPTAVFFPADEGPMRIGSAAVEALIAGEEGRFMRALKSVLGLPLIQERRLISGRRRSVQEIIAAFLEQIRLRAEAQTGHRITRALSGRPVHFHSADAAKDAAAERDLRACYHAAGFEEVSFLAEPEAAALAAARGWRQGQIGLIVDIGGGTSDFTIVRQDGTHPRVLASHGVRLGGTDFDHALSLSHVMPSLGLGTEVRREMGPGLLPVPVAPFADLATWAKIPFLYTPETRRMVAELLRLSVAPDRLGRLAQVLDLELGHDIAFAVEAGKIAANAGEKGAAIDVSFIERDLALPLTRTALSATLRPHKTTIAAALHTTVERAGLRAAEVDHVVLVGGSSLMSLVLEAVRDLCPDAEIEHAEAFTAVVDGLALATEMRAPSGAPHPS